MNLCNISHCLNVGDHSVNHTPMQIGIEQAWVCNNHFSEIAAGRLCGKTPALILTEDRRSLRIIYFSKGYIEPGPTP